MMEFGARLSLKDNMYATLQKNLKLQREFSEQVNRTRGSINELAKQKNIMVRPTIRLRDQFTSKVGKIKQNIKEISRTYTPIVKAKDLAQKLISKIKNTLGGFHNKIFTPIIKAKDGASKMLSSMRGQLKTIGNMAISPLVSIKDGAMAGLSKIKSVLSTLAKGVTIGVGLAGAGLTALTGKALSQGASLEQSIGGVETLFKADAGRVIANADKAFMTAGLSANEYMETVTGFSASLLQSLGGDTAKSAQIADMALIDMADNANKFGTDMSSIQTAYQGFAKQNYTMLDNLKLGYGGTKEEMDRLLKDAQKLTGVKYDISNLADVYSAIHAIQDNLGVAGATAKEASSTFSGSFAMMKASVKNLLGNLALGGDITASMEAVIDSASTFLFDNAIPMLGRIFESLPTAIGMAIEKGAPKMKELGGKIVTALKNGLKTMLPAELGELVDPLFDSIGAGIKGAVSGIKAILSGAIPVVTKIVSALAPLVMKIGGMFEKVVPVVQDALVGAFGNSGGLLDTFVNVIESAMPVVETVIKSVSGVIKTVIPPVLTMIQSLGNVFTAVMPIVSNLVTIFGQVIQAVYPVIYNTISTALNAVIPIINAFSGLIQGAMPIVQGIIQTFSNVVATIFPVVQDIFQGLGDKIAQVVGVVTEHMGLVQGVFETVSPIIQGAIEIVASVLSTAWDIISPIIDLAISIFDALLSCVEAVFPAIQTVVETVWAVLEPIFGAIADGLGLIGDAVNAVGGVVGKIGDGIGAVGNWIGDGVGAVGDFFGFAYGKDRVPYDNYPAVLHEGEKVLTRNQADQYDRSVSTRGVKLNNELQPVDTRGKSSSINSSPVIESNEGSKGNTEINLTVNNTFTGNINNVGDIEDVTNQVAEQMVKKFRKLVPNMA